MKTIKISKAQPIRDQKIESVTIEIDQEFPDTESDALGKLWHHGDAADLEGALYNALPGGTYDRLLGMMLSRKASAYRVTYGQLEAANG